jgi:hypothetical protein
MARLDSDSSADLDGGAGNKESSFEGEDVVAKVFAGGCDNGGPGGWIEELNAEHGLMVTERRASAQRSNFRVAGHPTRTRS